MQSYHFSGQLQVSLHLLQHVCYLLICCIYLCLLISLHFTTHIYSDYITSNNRNPRFMLVYISNVSVQ